MNPLRTDGDDSSDEVQTATHYVLGDACVGTVIAERLRAAGHRVAVVDDSFDSGAVPGVAGDPATVEILAESGVATASTVIIVTESDRRNLLVAGLVRARFGVPRIIALVHDPDRIPVFADAGHEPLCATTALAEAVGETV